MKVMYVIHPQANSFIMGEEERNQLVQRRREEEKSRGTGDRMVCTFIHKKGVLPGVYVYAFCVCLTSLPYAYTFFMLFCTHN